MDSAKNRDNRNGHQPGQDWEDAAFSWDNMKGDIFQKIQEEDPHFFEEKRKRRIPLWLWGSATVVLLAGLGFWFSRAPQTTSAPIETPANTPHTPAKKNQPVASIPEPAVATTKTSPLQVESTDISKENQNENLLANNLTDEVENTQSNPTAISVESSNEAKKSKANFNKLTSATNQPDKQPPSSIQQKNLAPAAASLPLHPIKPFQTKQPDLFVFTAPVINPDMEKAPWRVTAAGGSLTSFTKYSGASEAAEPRNDHSSAFFGYQYGVDAWAPLSQKDYFTFGINRQVIFQNIDIETQTTFDTTLQDVLVSTTHHVVGNLMSNRYDDTLVTATQRYRLVEYNEFRSIQLQAGYARVFQQKNWQFSPFVRMALGLMTDMKGRTVAADQSIFAFDNDRPIHNRFQFSTQVGVAVEHQLNQHFALFLQYNVSQQWNNASKEDNLKLRPAFHSFSVGIAKTFK
ncbi:MAG: hypothetical protein AAFZ15_31095 [Bacteroidota bacterium]